MRLVVLFLTALVFGALLLFDTTALIQLGWMCLTGQCGVSKTWVISGLGVLVLACLLPTLIRRWGPRKAGASRARRPGTAARKRRKR